MHKDYVHLVKDTVNEGLMTDNPFFPFNLGQEKMMGKGLLSLSGRAFFDGKFKKILNKIYNKDVEFIRDHTNTAEGDGDFLTVATFHRLYNLGKIAPYESKNPKKTHGKNYKTYFPGLSDGEVKYFIDKIGATAEWKKLDASLEKWLKVEQGKKAGMLGM